MPPAGDEHAKLKTLGPQQQTQESGMGEINTSVCPVGFGGGLPLWKTLDPV